ncbi:hypothetical protein TRFO_30173 [Tritrichomonas foetus]|uniref:BEACH domain-containing protein n=1 Tax=Tritrichomonas foetus TaxID=1144522 RepID=A0A1J4JUJ8_9EUKA|nr:hypothetical protein TRFO_30173 [Tritrichomonas foetus]|eukprot:OHT02675.1 hypothetical protein TRFO_30173 [Tritrichomonas foetus]
MRIFKFNSQENKMNFTDSRSRIFLGPEVANQESIILSPEYVTLTEKWLFYLDPENENQQDKNFCDFCSFYSKLLLNNNTKKIGILVTPKVVPVLIKHGLNFSDNPKAFQKCIKTLRNAFSVSPVQKINNQLLALFYGFLDVATKYNEIISESSIFFSSIFAQRTFCIEIANTPFLNQIITNCFIKNPSQVVAQYLQLLIFNQIDKYFFQSINYKKITLFLISCMNDKNLPNEMHPHLALFFCSFIQQISVISKGYISFVIENDGISSLELILNESNRIYIYSELILAYNDDKSPPPNILIIKYLYSQFQKHENLQNVLFDLIFATIQGNPDFFMKLNSIVPIKKWFETTHLNIKSGLVLLNYIKAAFPDDIQYVLKFFFKYLDIQGELHQISSDDYLNCVNLIDNLFTKRLVSLKYLISLDFLKIFVLNPSHSQLADFFIKSPTFTQLTLDTLSHQESFERRETVFESIIQMCPSFNDQETFISICSAFLVAAPSKIDVKRVYDEINETGKYSLVSIFSKAFPKSLELTNNFVSLGLLKWVSNLFDNSYIDIITLSNLFAALVVQRPYRELDILISSFHKDHPIFSLDKVTIDRIVYGLKDISIYPHRPIRVCSLFHLLDCPEQCSPYNAWVIGKYSLSNFEDFEKVPLLPCVANRFMHAADVERALKYPKMFEKFVDLSYDHFSMFQFYSGTEEMRIEKKYTTLSFWFIFSEELSVDVHLFHADNIMFDINENSLTVICDGQTIVVDAEPTKWTHVFIRFESSLMSQSVRITLNNENTFAFLLKTKMSEFTHACFSAARGSPMMFLGSAIRFSSVVPKDFSMIYSHGPGYIEPSDELNESLLVTPFELSNISVPLNCFPVPYMGFAVHNLSNHNFKVMMRHLREAGDVETYNSVFRAICNINKITRNYNKRFWKQLLHSVKHAKIYPSTELLESALETVVTPKHSDKIFGTILYGNNLWDIVNNEALVCALFDMFPNTNWKMFQDSDIFLAKIVEKNPSNAKIINKIIIHNRRVPKTFKLLAALLKSAPISEWNSASKTPRDESSLQYTILDSFINIIDKKNIELFKQLLTFDELRYIFITAPEHLAVKIYHFIVLMAAFVIDFIQIDSPFLIKLASLCKHASVWMDTMFLVSGDPDCKSTMVRRPAMIPLLLHLLWSGGAYLVHCKSYSGSNSSTNSLSLNNSQEMNYSLSDNHNNSIDLGNLLTSLNDNQSDNPSNSIEDISNTLDTAEIELNSTFNSSLDISTDSVSMIEKFDSNANSGKIKTVVSTTNKIEEKLEKVVNYLLPIIPQIVNRPDCSQIFSTYFPLIFNYTVLFDPNFILDEIQSPARIPRLQVSNLGDASDPTWSESISRNKDIKFSDPPTVQTSKVFLRSMVSLFISMPKNENDEILQPNMTALESFILTSPLSSLLCEIIMKSGSNAPSLALSLFVSQPFFNVSRSKFIVKNLSHILLNKTDLPSLSTVLQVIFILAGKRYLSDDSSRIFNDLFILSNMVHHTLGNEGLERFSQSFMQIFLIIFTTIPNEDYSLLYEILEANVDIFVQMSIFTKMEKCWIYGFSIAFNEIEDISGVLQSFVPENDEYINKDEKYKGKIDNIKLIKPEIIKICHNDWEKFTSNVLALYEQGKSSLIPPSKTIISEASLEFTKKTYIANCKHFLVRQLLNDAFQFIDSSFPVFIEKRKWSSFLVLLQEQRSSKSKFDPKCYHLSPRCSPFYPPKVLAPSPWPYFQADDYTKSPFIEMFENNLRLPPPKRDKRTLISLFYSKFRKWGYSLAVHECNFLRYSNPIPTISFWFPDAIILLTFSRMKNGEIEFTDLQDPIDPKTRHIFLESVFLGHFGLTSLFISHVVVIIPLYSILYVLRFNMNSLAFWTFNSGHFLLQFDFKSLRQVTPYLDKIVKIAVDSFPLENYLTQSRTNHESLSMLNENKITVQQFMFTLNALSMKSFADLNNYPFIPRLIQTDEDSEFDRKVNFPDGQTVANLLFRILPFRYFATDSKPLDITHFTNLPANILAIPEILKDINNFGVGDCDITKLARSPRHFAAVLRESLENQDNHEQLMQWVHLHYMMTPTRSSSLDHKSWQQISGPSSNHKRNQITKASQVNRTLSGHSRPANQLQPMTNRLHRQQTTVISVSRRLSRLTFINNITDKVLFCEYHHLYGLAESISVSIDGVFFVIDFAFGITRAYKVIFSSGNPQRAKCISEFSAGAKPKSSVSGHDWLCATASGKRLAFWEIITGTVHRLIKFDSTITAVAFDESGYYVWVAVGKKIYIIGINGSILGECEVSPENITALMHIDRKPTAFCGTEHGRIFMLTFDLTSSSIDIHELESKHKDPIEKIVQQRVAKHYFSVDSTGRIEKWNPEGDSINDESSVFTSCAVCTAPTHTLCQFCNKPVCAQCMPNHSKGPNCRHCIAFI